MNDLLLAIANYGFPCVMCLLLFHYVKYQNDTVTKAVNKLNDSITVLCAILDKGGGLSD